MARKAGRTPTVSYGDSFNVGQLAQHWERPISFVNDLLAQGKLTLNDQGLITNSALAYFYKHHGELLHA